MEVELDRWQWTCERSSCGTEIGSRERMEAIAAMHRQVTKHSTFVLPYRVPSVPGLPHL